MKWISSGIVLVVALFTFTGTASADVIVDCSGKEEGDVCSTPDGDGTCQEKDGSLTCVTDDNSNADAGTDAGDAGDDAGDAGDEGGDTGGNVDDDAGTMQETAEGSGSSDNASDEGGCSTTGTGPLGTLAPMLVGLLLFAVARRD